MGHSPQGLYPIIFLFDSKLEGESEVMVVTDPRKDTVGQKYKGPENAFTLNPRTFPTGDKKR